MIQHIYGRKPPRVVVFRVIPSCFCHRAAEISFSIFFNETGNKFRKEQSDRTKEGPVPYSKQ